MLPAAISIAAEDSVGTLTTTYELTDLLPSDDPNTIHVMNKYVHFQGIFNRGYFCRKHDKINATKIQGSMVPHALKRKIDIIIVIGFP